MSHGSAAALWGIGTEGGRDRGLYTATSSGKRRPGITPPSLPAVARTDVEHHEGIPLTSPDPHPARSATRLHALALERAINEADKRDLTDPEALREALDAYRGQPGVVRLREVLDRRTFRLTDSELERRFLPLVRSAGLPPP